MILNRLLKKGLDIFLSLILLISAIPAAAAVQGEETNALSEWIALADNLLSEKRNYISGKTEFLNALNNAKKGNLNSGILISELKKSWANLIYTVSTQLQIPLDAAKNNLGVAALGSHYSRKSALQPQFEWQIGAGDVSYWDNVESVSFYMNGYKTGKPGTSVTPNWGTLSLRLSDGSYAELGNGNEKYDFYKINGAITSKLMEVTVPGDYFKYCASSAEKGISSLILKLGGGASDENTLTVGSLFITRRYTELLPAEPAISNIKSGAVRYGTICTISVPSGTDAYYTTDGTVPTVYSEKITDGETIILTKPSLKILSSAEGYANAVVSYDFELSGVSRSELLERIFAITGDIGAYENLINIRLAARASLIPQGTQSDDDYSDFCNLCESFAAVSGEKINTSDLKSFLSSASPKTDFSHYTDTEIIKIVKEWNVSGLSDELKREHSLICRFVFSAQSVSEKTAEHGKLLIENAFAKAGEKVVIDVRPDDGYRIKNGTLLIYKDGIATIVPQRVGFRENTANCDLFEFIMPEGGKISVGAVFEKSDASPLGHIGRAKREHYSGGNDALRVINRCYLNGNITAYGIIIASQEAFISSGADSFDLSYHGKMTRIDSRDSGFVLYDRCREYVDFSAAIVYSENSPNKKKNIISRAYAIDKNGEIYYSELLICSFENPANACLSSDQLIYGNPAGNAGHILSVSAAERNIIANEKTELILDIADTFENPYDSEAVSLNAALTGPNGKKYNAFGFYSEDYTLHNDGNITSDGTSHWRFRLSLPSGGLWRFDIALTADGKKLDSLSGYIEAGENPNGDRSVCVSKNNSTRFSLRNGAAFTPIGLNVGWLKSFSEYAGYVNEIAKNGGNYMRIWLSQLGLSLMKKENAPNDFSSGAEDAAALDALVELCEERGVYLQTALFYHGAFSSDGTDAAWRDNPFNIIRNGYLSSPELFWTNESARTDTKNYIRYILARWGYSRSIFSIELCNEITSAAGESTDIKAWCEEMTAYLRENDAYGHMISVSAASINDTLPADDCFDFINVHTYRYSSAAALEKQVKQLAEEYNRPVFITEIGVDYASEIINADVFNQQNWIGVMASAGVGATWYWKSVYDGAMLDRLSFISSFAAKIPFENGVKSVSCTSNSSTTGAMGYAADNKAWIWVYDSQSIITYTNRTPSAASNSTTKITIPISAGSHTYRVYDSAKGSLLGTGTVKSQNGFITVTLPEWSKSIALEIV